MRTAIRAGAAGVALALVGVGLFGCSSSGGTSSSGGETGPITYVQGKDNNNIVPKIAAMWNKLHPDQKVTIKQQSTNADQQHQDLVLHFQSKSTAYDVVSVDVVWTAEFAAKQWLQPLTGAYKLNTSAMVPAIVKTATYHNTLYAGPASTDSQLLYYRKDLLGSKPVPTTWAEMMADCPIAKKAGIGCYTGQFAKYEGLTVNFGEAVNSAGGTVVGPDGTTPTLDTPQAHQGLQNLVDAFKDGNIPASAITYMEEDGRQAFEAGKLLFYTNWPYAYSLTKTDGSSKVKDTFGIAPYPGASTLGGHNIAISAFSKHKTTALNFVKFMESPSMQKFFVTKASLSPVLSASYSDNALDTAYPYLPVLKKSLDTAVSRPVSPYYPAVTQAIQDNTYAALKGSVTVDQALASMQTALKNAGNG